MRQTRQRCLLIRSSAGNYRQQAGKGSRVADGNRRNATDFAVFVVSRNSRSRRPVGNPRRGAFSLLELLVALVVIGVLISLMLPAVVSSRESARRVQCLNQMRQLAVACHSFHDNKRSLPQQNYLIATGGSVETGTTSVWAQLLPYLDQPALYERLDFNEDGTGLTREPPTSRFNSGLLEQSIPLLMCPTDFYRRGATSYRVCLGTAPGPPHRERSGVFFSLGQARRRATFAMVVDGLSNTAMIAERSLGDGNPNAFSVPRDVVFVTNRPFSDPDAVLGWCADGQAGEQPEHASYAGATWLLSGYSCTWYNHVNTPNSGTTDCTNGGFAMPQAALSARSQHPSGVNVGFADGGCRTVNSSISMRVWRALGTRAGGEVSE